MIQLVYKAAMVPFRPLTGLSCNTLYRSLVSGLILLIVFIQTSGCSGVNEYKYRPDHVLKAEMLQSFPHDPNAFTQGLAWDDGVLIESTGLKGASSLRKILLNTGAVCAAIFISCRYFRRRSNSIPGQNLPAYMEKQQDIRL